MISKISVRLVPNAISPSDCDNCVVVMADILRASTTMITALANGAAAIYPRAEIAESRELASQLGPATVLGGERNGKIVDGFDQGNSPLEYVRDQIEGKNLVLCTTNGTFTLKHCKNAERLLIGAFVNLSALNQQVTHHDKLMIACAGTNRMVTDEDVLFAGALIEKSIQTNSKIELDDAAKIALCRWQSVQSDLQKGIGLWETLAKSHGGRNLMRLGYDHDVKYCANIDTHSVVPELDLKTWIISTAMIEA